MKAFVSTILSVCLLVAGVTCACELQALPMDLSMDHGGEGSHGAMHQMDQSMPCDHTDCGNGCLATGTISKTELAPKSIQFVDLDDAVSNTGESLLNNEPLSATETGPPYVLSALQSTPVTRRDLLLE